MDAVKNTVKAATGSSGQYEPGHKVPITHQPTTPGLQHALPETPINDQLPTGTGSYQPYLAAGKLRGRRALITGGDSGIGRAVAILYAMEGAESTIVYTASEEEDAQETKRLVEGKGGRLHLVAADLRSSARCRGVVEEARRGMGGLDVLVLNHGTQMMRESIDELSEEQWLDTFNTNIHPFFYIAKHALPHMKRGDTIITCASINPYIGRSDLLDYTATKGAIVAFTRGLANQQIGRGIRVNAVCPGPTDIRAYWIELGAAELTGCAVWTPLIPATMSSKAQDAFTSPMGRPGQPAEVATCFVFLASADSSFMSGQALHPNGGTVVGS